VKFISREKGYKQRVTKGEIRASTAKSRRLFNAAVKVCFSALKRLPRVKCVSLVGVKFLSREKGYKQRVTKGEIRASTAKSRRLFNAAVKLYFFGVKTPPTCVMCITCRRGFSRESYKRCCCANAPCKHNAYGLM